jgi:hypothetical protein
MDASALKNLDWDAIIFKALTVYGHWLLAAGAYFVTKFAIEFSLRHSGSRPLSGQGGPFLIGAEGSIGVYSPKALAIDEQSGNGPNSHCCGAHPMEAGTTTNTSGRTQ